MIFPVFCLYLFLTNQSKKMKTRITFFIFMTLSFAGCQSNYYTAGDYQSVLKIDSHIHINSDDGAFEDQAQNWIILY